MAVNEDYLEFIKDQLSNITPFETKRMFGGVGFFKNGLMFGMLGKGVFRLKVDETNQQEYEDQGMKPLMSKTGKKGMPYWEVPVEVFEDKSELTSWVQKSIEVAQNAANKK